MRSVVRSLTRQISQFAHTRHIRRFVSRLSLFAGLSGIGLVPAGHQWLASTAHADLATAAYHTQDGLNLPPLVVNYWELAFDGRDTLVVGDSMVHRWPWEADRLALPGQGTPVIRGAFERNVADRRYDTIVLWTGTAHFAGRQSPEQYVDDMAAMIATARAHSERVVLIGPFPSFGPAYDPLQTAFAQVRLAAPDLTAVELVELHALLVDTRKLMTHVPDGIHLTMNSARGLLGPPLSHTRVTDVLRPVALPVRGAPEFS